MELLKQNSMQQEPQSLFKHAHLSHFFYRAKYFQGKKVNGEFDIRVEQVSDNLAVRNVCEQSWGLNNR